AREASSSPARGSRDTLVTMCPAPRGRKVPDTWFGARWIRPTADSAGVVAFRDDRPGFGEPLARKPRHFRNHVPGTRDRKSVGHLVRDPMDPAAAAGASLGVSASAG